MPAGSRCCSSREGTTQGFRRDGCVSQIRCSRQSMRDG
jgi:hypothetical protein